MKSPGAGSSWLFHEVRSIVALIFIPGRNVSVGRSKLCQRIFASETTWPSIRTKFPESKSFTVLLKEVDPPFLADHNVLASSSTCNGKSPSGFGQWVIAVSNPYNYTWTWLIPYPHISSMLRASIRGGKTKHESFFGRYKRFFPAVINWIAECYGISSRAKWNWS